MKYSAHAIEDLRLRILGILHQAPGYGAGDAVLRSELRSHGHRVSADVLRVEIAWLVEQRLVTSVEFVPGSRSIVATLTERGADVAAGVADVPGVRRPAPHELA